MKDRMNMIVFSKLFLVVILASLLGLAIAYILTKSTMTEYEKYGQSTNTIILKEIE